MLNKGRYAQGLLGRRKKLPMQPPATPCNPYQSQLAHLLKMARLPGAKHHAWYRAKELSADGSGLWKGIDKELAEAMKAQHA